MFRKEEVIIIRERRRMSGVQMVATGLALLALCVALPHLISAAKEDAFPSTQESKGQLLPCKPQPGSFC